MEETLIQGLKQDDTHNIALLANSIPFLGSFLKSFPPSHDKSRSACVFDEKWESGLRKFGVLLSMQAMMVRAGGTEVGKLCNDSLERS